MMVIVPLAGELKFYPFNDTYRVSFAPPAFFFFLLFLRKVPAFLPGFLIGLSIVGFRVILDVLTIGHLAWSGAFGTYYPVFLYYFTYSCVFYLLKINRFHDRSFLIGFFGVIAEVISDLVELVTEYGISHNPPTLMVFNKVFIIAIFRSFFVLGFFNMMKLYESRLKGSQVRNQNQHLMMLVSNLYEESIHLKKTLRNAENITKKSYDLYKDLKQADVSIEESRSKALAIAGEVHEIKKDNQRIFAGLSNLISKENLQDYLPVDDLIRVVVRSNRKYARLHGKDIDFVSDINGEHPDYHVYTILSILNNLVANAVEAIKETGTITISINKLGDSVECRIGDNGPGISPKHQQLIFKPGFTLKYDQEGNSSTGIGLSYVKEIVEQLEGEIGLEEGPEGMETVFLIRLPVRHLTKEG
ncbi:sensor histidine kinase [Scopulibacillus darangshiensis]|nr:sensor histidine kinase [Scopulibacillus darangshiensis]